MKRSYESMKNKSKQPDKEIKDIIRENCLPYLPAKTVYRFNGVCIDWKKWISTPIFAHNQSIACRDVSGFFYQFPSKPPSFISLDSKSCGVPDPTLKFLPEAVAIRCSSNGLLCCQGLTGRNAYYICNPVTKQWKKLPQHKANHGPDPALVLVFEPSSLNFDIHYKLVCAYPTEMEAHEFEIYSSANGSWKISDDICLGDRYILPRSGIHVGGVVYWDSIGTFTGNILAFDLTSERTTFLNGQGFLGQFNGKPCVSSFYYDSWLSVYGLYDLITQTSSVMMSVIKMEDLELDIDTYQEAKVLYMSDEVVAAQFRRSLFAGNLKTNNSSQLVSAVELPAKMVPYINNLAEFC